MTGIKLDKTDYKILYELDYDSRQQRSKLAKRIGISKQNLNYRLKRLEQQGVIKGYLSVIDGAKLGNIAYRLFVRFGAPEKREELVAYFANHPAAIWVVSLAGRYDLEAVFAARNVIAFNNIIKQVRLDIGQHLQHSVVSADIATYHFPRDYLIGKERVRLQPLYFGLEPKEEPLDLLDLKLLKLLSLDCSRSCQEMGALLGVNYNTVKARLRDLEERKVVQGHRVFMDISKIGRRFYKALFSLNSRTREEEQALYEYCSTFPEVVYINEVMGDGDLEIEAEAESDEQFDAILVKVRDRFPNLIRDYDTLRVTAEHRMNYLPNVNEMIATKEGRKG